MNSENDLEQMDEDELGFQEDPEEVQKEMLECMSQPDYVMQPTVGSKIERYLNFGGNATEVINVLSENYAATAQMVNLLAEWLIHLGLDIDEVQATVETHLKDMLIKHFDPQKADSIFTQQGETPAWLSEMIEHPTWRSLVYQLAEEYPDCLMLNFTIKLISDVGHEEEIRAVPTACHQIEVFSRVLRTSIYDCLRLQDSTQPSDNVAEFTKMVCIGEHTYLYSQAVMQVLSREGKQGAQVKRLSQEIQQNALENGFDVTPISLALSGASNYPRACQALAAMLSAKKLNPADMSVLYKMYSSSDPPPVQLIRNPQFLDIAVDTLFRPGAKLNPEHKPKYIYLLAYAASVFETKKGARKSSVVNKDELPHTREALQKAQTLCAAEKGSSELVADLAALYHCIRYPVVAVGVLHWIDCTVSQPSYFKLNTDHTPIHLVVLDELGTLHHLLHERILLLLTRLFECDPGPEVDVLVTLELRKTLLDRFVHLLSRGCVLPLLTYLRRRVDAEDTDASLLRYFVSEVLDMISPPYTSELVELLRPLVENEDITGPLRVADQSDPVSQFITHCNANFVTMPV